MRKTFWLYFLALAACIAASGAVAAPPVMMPVLKAPPPNAEPFRSRFSSVESYDPPVPAPSLIFHAVDGNMVKLNELKGKWSLINFWATWCAACVAELPSLLALEQARKDGLDVVFVSLDSVASAEDLKKRMKKARIPENMETLYVLDSGVWNQLQVNSLPTTVILSPEGRLRYKLVGETDWMAKESLEFIDDLINNQPQGHK